MCVVTFPGFRDSPFPSLIPHLASPSPQRAQLGDALQCLGLTPRTSVAPSMKWACSSLPGFPEWSRLLGRARRRRRPLAPQPRCQRQGSLQVAAGPLNRTGSFIAGPASRGWAGPPLQAVKASLGWAGPGPADTAARGRASAGGDGVCAPRWELVCPRLFPTLPVCRGHPPAQSPAPLHHFPPAKLGSMRTETSEGEMERGLVRPAALRACG